MLRLTSHPGAPLRGVFAPPGDKSITHRIWLLGLLNAGTLHVRHANIGADCVASRDVAAALGAAVRGDSITGTGGRLVEPGDVLDCGNSGTTLRLLAGILATQPFVSVLTGDESLRRRPLERIVEPLARMGARILARDGGRLAPLAIGGGRLRAIEHVSPVASAQVLSSVLLAGLGAEGRTVVELPGPARDHTERLLGALGVPLENAARAGGGRRVAVEGPRPITAGERTITVPGDFSAAAFFLAGAAAREGATVTATSVSLNPTRTGLLDVLERMGATVTRANLREAAGEPVGDVTVTGARLRGVDVPPEWMPRWLDEVPAWAVAAARARGRSRITGGAELRVKESDRIASLVANLSALGIAARELPDGLEIEGGVPGGGQVEARGDHRLAMAFAVLGSVAGAPVVVDDATRIGTSYPDFGRELERLGGEAVMEEREP